MASKPFVINYGTRVVTFDVPDSAPYLITLNISKAVDGVATEHFVFDKDWARQLFIWLGVQLHKYEDS